MIIFYSGIGGGQGEKANRILYRLTVMSSYVEIGSEAGKAFRRFQRWIKYPGEKCKFITRVLDGRS